MERVLISLCDESLEWSLRFAKWSGWKVVAVDPKHRDRWGQRAYAERIGSTGTVTYIGDTVAGFIEQELPRLMDLQKRGDIRVIGVIAQPVCTQFSGAGARHWARKDREQPELLAEAKRLVSDCLHVVAMVQPEWWVFENPVGRMGRVCGLGKPVMTYQPHEYAHLLSEPSREQYTKRTCLWGNFNADALKAAKGNMQPLPWGKNGNTSKMHACYGGSSDRTKELRSKTPAGFSHAFWDTHKDKETI